MPKKYPKIKHIAHYTDIRGGASQVTHASLKQKNVLFTFVPWIRKLLSSDTCQTNLKLSTSCPRHTGCLFKPSLDMNTGVINSKQRRINQFQHIKANSNINKTHKNKHKIKTNMAED